MGPASAQARTSTGSREWRASGSHPRVSDDRIWQYTRSRGCIARSFTAIVASRDAVKRQQHMLGFPGLVTQRKAR